MTELPSGLSRISRGEKVIERALSLFAALRAAPRGLTWREVVAAVEGYSDSDAGRKAFLRDRGMLEAAGFSFVQGDFSAPEYRYQLAESADIPDFTAQEEAALALAAVSLSDASVAKSAALAVERLTAELAADEPHPLMSWRPLLPADSQLLAVVSRAIADRAPLDFTYANAAGVSSRRLLWPWAVQVHANDWYALGFDSLRRQPRIFRFSRMSGVRPVRPDSTSTGDPVPLADRAELVRGMLSALSSEAAAEVEILVRPGRLPWARAFGRQWSDSVEGWERYTLPGERKDDLLNSILSAPAGDAAVIGPAEVREEFLSILDAVEKAHSADPVDSGGWPPLRRERNVLSPHDRVYRCFTMLRLLAENGPTHASELAETLHVPRDVLEEDIRAMSYAEAGFDASLSLEFDDDGWVSLIRDEIFEQAPLPPLEQLIPLVAALGHLAREAESDSPLSAAACSVQLKLLLSADGGGEAEHWAAQSILEASRAGDSVEPLRPLLSTALSAVSTGRGLVFRYLRDTEEESRARWVLPRGVLFEHGRHYISGLEVSRGQAAAVAPADSSHGERLKHFRLDRCAELELWTPDPELRASLTDTDAASPHWAKRRKSRTAVQAEILARSSSVRPAVDWLDTFNARDIRGESRDLLAGAVNVAGSTLLDEILISRGAVSLEGPPELRQEIRRRCALLRKVQDSVSKIG